MHQNLCRQRKLVAIGTHDLDTIEGPFRYECKDPKNIKFAPLNKKEEFTAEQLMTVYEVSHELVLSYKDERRVGQLMLQGTVGSSTLEIPPHHQRCSCVSDHI